MSASVTRSVAVAAAVIGAAIGAGYGFLVLVTMGIAGVVFVLIMWPFLALLARSQVPIGRSTLGIAVLAGYVAGFVFAWAWLLVPLRLRCETPCGLVSTPAQDVLWGLIWVGIPLLLVAIALRVRTAAPGLPLAATALLMLTAGVGLIAAIGLMLTSTRVMTSSGSFSNIGVQTPASTPGFVGFYLPLKCRSSGTPTLTSQGVTVSIDCGAENADARAALAPSLTEQGWIACGTPRPAAIWTKSDMRIVIDETPGALPTIREELSGAGRCP